MDSIELLAFKLESVDTALMVDIKHGPVEDHDVSVKWNVGAARKTRLLVRKIEFVLVTMVLKQKTLIACLMLTKDISREMQSSVL